MPRPMTRGRYPPCASQVDAGPRGRGSRVYLVLHPVRSQAWAEVDKTAGSGFIRDGVRLV